MERIFKDITTYDGCLYGLYEISNDGWLRNKQTGYLTKGSLDMDGYYRTHLPTNNGGHINVKIHQLVLRTFLGEPPCGKDIVNHKNEIKTDNRVENLEWCSPAYNATYGTKIERSSNNAKKSGKHRLYKPTEESKQKGRETRLKNLYPDMTFEEIEKMLLMRHLPVPKEVKRQRMSESQKKRWTDEMRENMSERMSGEGNPMYGKHHSEESIRKSAEGHKKTIYQYDRDGNFIREWDSATDAAKYYGVNVNAISNALDSKWKSCGYIWKRKFNG